MKDKEHVVDELLLSSVEVFEVFIQLFVSIANTLTDTNKIGLHKRINEAPS